MTQLAFIPPGEFERVRNLNCSPAERAAVFANLCRFNALYMIAKAGSGHIGTSFSCLDILSWIYLNELGERHDGDASRGIYFSSKGHDAPALYAVLAGIGLIDFDLIHQLRRIDGLPGHPDICTPGISANTGSLGMGISKAKGMAFARRRKGQSEPIFVLTGDGELQEGQLWESLASAANNRNDEIIAIVDHNKIQSDTWVSEVSDLGNIEAKFASFGWQVGRCDGHDVNAIAEAINQAKDARARPSVIIADTVKGKGVTFMEGGAIGPQDLYQFHSGAPAVDFYISAIEQLRASVDAQLDALGASSLEVETTARETTAPAAQTQRLVEAYSRALVASAASTPSLIALDADLVLDTGLIPFRDAYPDRFVECGIAEQDMVSQAGGMALEGLLPVVHSFACFLSTRPNEQIYNNATEQTKIIYVGSLAGVVPGGPGHSHQSVRDISALRGMPGLTLVEPACERETEAVVEWAVAHNPGSTYLRLVSIPCKVLFDLPPDYALVEGRGSVLREGNDALVVGYGPVMLSEAMRAAEILSVDSGIELKVVNLPWLNCIVDDWLANIADGARYIFTLDNHYVTGGQGEFVAARVAALKFTPQPSIHHFGLTAIPACGRNEEVLAHHGCDAISLADSIAAVVTQ